ncbi:unnamed protein product, partial [Heterosigma akashiwo]
QRVGLGLAPLGAAEPGGVHGGGAHAGLLGVQRGAVQALPALRGHDLRGRHHGHDLPGHPEAAPVVNGPAGSVPHPDR